MYCSSCAKEVVSGLTYCNHCGFKLNGAKGDDGKSLEVKPELLVSAMAGVFILGLVAIAVLIGVLKQVAGFDTPFLIATILLSFVMMLVVEGVFIWLLLKRKKVEKVVGDTQLNQQTTKEMYTASTRGLSEGTFEPISVTEHTTRTLQPVPKNNQ
jgi:uncharacterized protein (DUF983 family)